ncbi:MAG TPA: nucleoside 2-deoxyribosyltransferase domain-containing protein [Candidatus Microsaccharimonas sp.]|jgi:hypothetical protein
MNERLHLPPSDNPIPSHSSLVFLAGPIQGSPDWQTATAKKLLDQLPNTHIASPRRVAESHDEFKYNEQVLWELNHLRRANKLGVASFWFAARDFSLPYEKGRSYAKTTRNEVNRAYGWYDFQPFPLVLGFDPDYTPTGGEGERHIVAMANELKLPVYDSLDDVISQTILQLPTKH